MRPLRSALSLFALLWCTAAAAQPAQQWIDWGDAAMERQEYYGASKFYSEALRAEPGRLAIQWKQAEACRLSNQYDKATEFYGMVYRKDQGRTYADALRWLAEMQMCNGMYDEAEVSWRKLIQRERKKSAFNLERAENALHGCSLAKAITTDTTSIVVEHLPGPVNSYESEFAPRVSTEGSLYFSSLRGEYTADEEVEDTAAYRTRIYRSDEAEGAWAEPMAVAAIDNGDNANITWSLDGRRAYFTRCLAGQTCRIHYIDLDGADTTAKVLLGLGGEMSTQPMIVRWEDREMLLFVSDRPGGMGGTDIWQAQISGADVISVVPVNGKVNTPENERTPWFDPVTNELYFSSDFLPGLGGYDIFISTWSNDEFSAPINAGPPVNSPANDLYPAIDPQRGHFWFASNRIGSLAAKGATCCSDIYRYPLEKRPIIDPGEIAGTDTARSIYMAAIERIRSEFPLKLYFHNDDPDPRSWAQSTGQTYEQTYQRYRSLLPEYGEHGDRMATERFFTEHVEAGRKLLDDLIGAIVPALQNGEEVILSVRGHASPLAKNDYNRNLSQRRISSLENHLRSEDPSLAAFIDGTAPNGGRLRIEELPYGEERSARSVSDDLGDLQRSVYSIEAMRERRIEIEEIKLTDTGSSTEEIKLVQNVGDLLQDQERFFTFTLKNPGQRPLALVGSQADCGCTTADLPTGPIAPGGNAEVKVHFNGRAPVGPLTRSVTVITDGEPQRFRLTLEGRITDRDN